MDRPLAIDLCCGLSGWGESLIATGWRVIGYDIEDMFAAIGHPRPAEHFELVLQDILTLSGAHLAEAQLIVASPPCQKYSWMAMPWKCAKAQAAEIRADTTGQKLEDLNRLFNACFRIQKEACVAAGHHIPMVVENVKGAQPWVGRSRWNYGSFHLWGDVPALMPQTIKAHKVPHFRFDGSGRSFQTASVEHSGVKAPGMNWSDQTKRGQDFTRLAGEYAIKNSGGSWFNIGSPGQLVTNANPVHRLAADGRKQRGSGREWFAGEGTIGRTTSSKSPARKAASAMIAKIPPALAAHIGRVYLPS